MITNENSTVMGSFAGRVAALLGLSEVNRVGACCRKERRAGLADLRLEAIQCRRIENIGWLFLAVASAAALVVSLGLY